MFRVGQKVVCIRNGPSIFNGEPADLIRGRIYTISKFWICSVWLHPCCLVEEAEPTSGYAFDAKRFRPIVERKTDISIFREILSKATTQADTDIGASA